MTDIEYIGCDTSIKKMLDPHKQNFRRAPSRSVFGGGFYEKTVPREGRDPQNR